MPGYAHMQKAMPSSVGLWASSFVESLLDDIKILESLSKTTPLPYYSPKTKVTKMYHNIAKHIMGETENSVVIKQPFKSRVKNFLNRYITIESGNQPIKE